MFTILFVVGCGCDHTFAFLISCVVIKLLVETIVVWSGADLGVALGGLKH